MAYGVLAGGGDAIVGLLRLRRTDARFLMADVSFAFDEGAWDSHVPVRSLHAALDFAFRELALHRLELRTMAAREAAVVRELGATLEGRLRESWLVGDRLVDQNLWSILRSEWSAEPHLPLRLESVAAPAGSEAAPSASARDAEDASPLWARTPTVARRGTVTVREIRPDDVAALLERFTPEEIQVCIDPPTVTEEAFLRYVAWAQAERALGRAVSFVILTEDQQCPVGLVQVRQFERRAAVAEVGIFLAQRCRGTGVFPTAMRLVLDFTFQTMGVHRLEARTSGTNHAGEGSLRKLGAIREAHLRASFPRGPAFEDDELWSILSSDWRRTRRSS